MTTSSLYAFWFFLSALNLFQTSSVLGLRRAYKLRKLKNRPNTTHVATELATCTCPNQNVEPDQCQPMSGKSLYCPLAFEDPNSSTIGDLFEDIQDPVSVLGPNNPTDEGALRKFLSCQGGKAIIRRICLDCSDVRYRDLYYKRLTPVPDTLNLIDTLANNWRSANNELGTDFNIYESLDDALYDKNAWKYCNFDDPGVGFPRDCSRISAFKYSYQWNSFANRSGKRGQVAFFLYNEAGVMCPNEVLEPDQCAPISGQSLFCPLAFEDPSKRTLGNLFRDLQDKAAHTLVPNNVVDEEAVRKFLSCQGEKAIIRRICLDCSNAKYRDLYYKRLTPVPDELNLVATLASDWTEVNNTLGTHFNIYESLNDALTGQHAWQYCNYDDPGVGFPRDCGPTAGSKSSYQWNSLVDRGGGKKEVAFYLYNEASVKCPNALS